MSTKTPLTPRQEKVLSFIEGFQMKNGGSPTIKEIREHLKVSSDNGVLKHIRALQEKGYIERNDRPRGIKLVDKVRELFQDAQMLVKVPLLGEIAAGPTAVEESQVVGYYALDSSLVRHPKSTFMLRVRGDSMEDAGIHDGDMVIADRSQTPKHRDVVVALIDNENTVKRYMSKGGVVYLKPENTNYKNIFPKDQLFIQGVVTGLIRNY